MEGSKDTEIGNGGEIVVNKTRRKWIHSTSGGTNHYLRKAQNVIKHHVHKQNDGVDIFDFFLILLIKYADIIEQEMYCEFR